MARLIVLVNSPQHLSPAEAEDWLHGEASKLTSVDGVERGALCRLTSPADRWPNHWGWLIELECDLPDGAQRAVRDGAWREVLGDLRLLGMRPSVAVVAQADELAG